jgi:hypothetical protein
MNNPPRHVGIVPADIGPLHPSEAVTLVGDATDDDGDTLTFTWYLDGEEVHTGISVTLGNLSIGVHDITLVVSDGYDEGTAEARLEVISDRDDGGASIIGWTLGLAVVVAALLVLAAYISRRKG